MPSIIGNSTIFGGSGKTGPRGSTGNSGNIGGIGPLGTSGPRGLTGATGIYIAEVTSDLTNNTITFIPSDGSASISLFGFTGDVGYYSDSRGISASISSGYFSALSSVVGGNTFEFLGISGSGTIVSSLSTDKNEVIVTITPAASGTLYGNTASNFVAYTNSSYSATNTKIGITGSNSILSFGLTADGGATGNSVKVYTDFTETYFGITGGITLGYSPSSVVLDSIVVGADSGGLILNLNNNTTYKMSTPIGITSFVNSGVTGIVSYTFFIEGADVWNFPKNVNFENSPSGICGSDFLDGMNILHLWSDGGSLFNAAFVAKGLGSGSTAYSSRVGSCGYSGGCIDYTSPTECAKLSGVFNPQAKCANAIGSCCIDNICYPKVSQSVCSAYGGKFLANSPECIGCDAPSYSLTISDRQLPIRPFFVVPDSNKLFTLTILNNTGDLSYIHYPDTIGGSATNTFRFFQAKLPNGVTVNNLNGLTSGTTLGFYFNNDAHPDINGTTGIFNITLRGTSLSSPLSGLTSLNINFSYYSGGPGSGVSGCLDAHLISTEFTANRYCGQCYRLINGIKQYTVVQVQNGNITFAVAPDTCGWTFAPRCIFVNSVEDTDDCTRSAVDACPTDNCYDRCTHRDYAMKFDPTGTAAPGRWNTTWDCHYYPDLSTTPCDCYTISGDGTHIPKKGISDSDYWYDIKYDSTLSSKLKDIGITGIAAGLSGILGELAETIKSSTRESKPLLFTSSNEFYGITYYGATLPCCESTGNPALSEPLNFNDDFRYFAYNFTATQVLAKGGLIYDKKQAQVGGPQMLGPCGLYQVISRLYSVVIRAKLTTRQPTEMLSDNSMDITGESCVFISKSPELKFDLPRHPMEGELECRPEGDCYNCRPEGGAPDWWWCDDTECYKWIGEERGINNGFYVELPGPDYDGTGFWYSPYGPYNSNLEYMGEITAIDYANILNGSVTPPIGGLYFWQKNTRSSLNYAALKTLIGKAQTAQPLFCDPITDISCYPSQGSDDYTNQIYYEVFALLMHPSFKGYGSNIYPFIAAGGKLFSREYSEISSGGKYRKIKALRELEAKKLLLLPLQCGIGSSPNICSETPNPSCTFNSIELYNEINQYPQKEDYYGICNNPSTFGSVFVVPDTDSRTITPYVFEQNTSGQFVISTTKYLWYYAGNDSDIFIEDNQFHPTIIRSGEPIHEIDTDLNGSAVRYYFFYTTGLNEPFEQTSGLDRPIIEVMSDFDNDNLACTDLTKLHSCGNPLDPCPPESRLGDETCCGGPLCPQNPIWSFRPQIGIDSILINSAMNDGPDTDYWSSVYPYFDFFIKRKLKNGTWSHGNFIRNSDGTYEFVWVDNDIINWNNPELTENVNVQRETGIRYITLYITGIGRFMGNGAMGVYGEPRIAPSTYVINIYGPPDERPSWTPNPVDDRRKKINGVCHTINCVGIEAYCAGLEDC